MDTDSDKELSPEIQIKTRKRVLNPQPISDHDTSNTFLLNTTSSNGQGSSFCRSSYIQNIFSRETVLCCVMSTFTLDLPYLINELPCMLSSTANVDCMLVHGRLSNQSKIDISGEPLSYSAKLQIVEVSPQHKRTSHMGLVQNATHIMGVHHPKYLLIFVNSGVYVIISSSNLTPCQNSSDITWTQFFPLQQYRPFPQLDNKTEDRMFNDFGIVLEDFLTQESAQVRPSSLLPPNKGFPDVVGPMEFIWDHLQPLHKRSKKVTFATLFSFQDAKVHLVSTVPGRFAMPTLQTSHTVFIDKMRQTGLPCVDCVHHRDRIIRRGFATSSESAQTCGASARVDEVYVGRAEYGAQRIKTLLTTLAPMLPRELDWRDTLVLQPTSIGGGVSTSYMAELLSFLMPESSWDDSEETDKAGVGSSVGSQSMELVRMDSMKIVWPSAEFMSLCHSHRIPPMITNSGGGHGRGVEMIDRPLGENEQVFFLPMTLAQMGADIQTQMHLYQVSPSLLRPVASAQITLDRAAVKVPHNKTYLRLLGSSEHSTCPVGGGCPSSSVECSCRDIAWLLLSSACLSKGAQGDLVPPSLCNSCGHVREGYFEYKNFELGVLFHSNIKASHSSSSGVRYKIPVGTCPLHGEVGPSSESNEHPPDPVPFSLSTPGPGRGRVEASEREDDPVCKKQRRKLSEEWGGACEVLLPLPYEAVYTAPYVGRDGQFLHQPYFHDAAEMTKLNLGVVSSSKREQDCDRVTMKRHASFQASYRSLTYRTNDSTQRPLQRDVCKETGKEVAAASGLVVTACGSERLFVKKEQSCLATDFLCD